jgi:hypothetical protein
MKKLIIFLLMFGCGNDYRIYLDDALTIDTLLEYNIILCRFEGRCLCGGTVIESSDDGSVILTAAHCVDENADYDIKINDGTKYKAEVIGFTYDLADLALLFSETLPKQRAATLCEHEPDLGSDVWLLGFGAAVEDVVSLGSVSKLGTQDHSNRKTNMFDITGWYGNSGGGVFSWYGHVCSAISQFGPQFYYPSYHGAETGWMYGSTSEELRNFVSSVLNYQ